MDDLTGFLELYKRSSSNETTTFLDTGELLERTLPSYFEMSFDSLLADNASSDGPGVPLQEVAASVFGWIKFIYSALVLVLGCFGNVSFIIYYFWLRSRGHLSSANEYLLAICIADLASLIALLRNWLRDLNAFRLTSNAICSVSTFGSFAGCFLCTWFIVAFSFERYVVVKAPLRVRNDIRTGRARVIISVISVVGLTYNIWALFGYRMEKIGYSADGVQICAVTRKFSKYFEVFSCMNLVVLFLAPFGIVVFLNTLIATMLRKRTRFLRGYMHVKSGFSHGDNVHVPRTDAAASRRLLFASLLYCGFNFPHYIWRFSVIFRRPGLEDFEMVKVVDDCLQMLLSTQYCVHCITYARVAMVLARRFRRTREFLLRHFSPYATPAVVPSPILYAQKRLGVAFIRSCPPQSASPTRWSVVEESPKLPLRSIVEEGRTSMAMKTFSSIQDMR